MDIARGAADKVKSQLGGTAGDTEGAAGAAVASAKARIASSRAARTIGIPMLRTPRSLPARGAAIAIVVLGLLVWGLCAVIAAKSPPVLGSYHSVQSSTSTSSTSASAALPVAATSAANGTREVPALAPGRDADKPQGWPTDPTRQGWHIVVGYTPGDSGAVIISLPQPETALGTSVHATHSGMVKTLRGSRAFGNLVYVIGSSYTTIYGYLAAIPASISDGLTVQAGAVIGTLGAGGQAGQPALNYQVWQCQGPPAASGTAGRICTNVNPMDYLKLWSGRGVSVEQRCKIVSLELARRCGHCAANRRSSAAANGSQSGIGAADVQLVGWRGPGRRGGDASHPLGQ